LGLYLKQTLIVSINHQFVFRIPHH